MSQSSLSLFVSFLQCRIHTSVPACKEPGTFGGRLTHSQRKAASAFIQVPQDYFDAEPTLGHSDEGELRVNLAEAQKDEAADVKAYEQLKAAKEDEIVAGHEQTETKTQELADADEKLAQSKEDLDDTKAFLAEGEAFLMMLKEMVPALMLSGRNVRKLASLRWKLALRHLLC